MRHAEHGARTTPAKPPATLPTGSTSAAPHPAQPQVPEVLPQLRRQLLRRRAGVALARLAEHDKPRTIGMKRSIVRPRLCPQRPARPTVGPSAARHRRRHAAGDGQGDHRRQHHRRAFPRRVRDAPQLVDEAGIILKDKDERRRCVWTPSPARRSPTSRASTGAERQLHHRRPADAYGVPVLADSVKDIAPPYAEKSPNIPPPPSRARANVREERDRRDDRDRRPELRYRPAVRTRSADCRRRNTASKVGAPASSSTLVGNIDAVRGLILGGAYAAAVLDSAIAVPPKRADCAKSIFYPYSKPHRQTPCLTVQDPKSGDLPTRGNADLLTFPTGRCRSRFRAPI